MMSVKKTQQLWKIKSRSLSSHVANEPLAKFADVRQENYQYLQKSPVPTTTFQKSLFRLPIPKVEDTCKRYLESQKQLLSKDAFAQTSKIVQAFETSDGPQLQKVLIAQDKANKHTSYISGPWTEMYLRDRRPVAFTHNPGLSFVDDPRPEFNRNTCLRASNLLISATRFFKSLQSNYLYPDVYHMNPNKTRNDNYWNKVKWMPKMIATPLSALSMQVFPLDMSQFPNLFQSTRIPMPDRDEIRRFPESRHILILHRGRFYTFDVLDQNGNIFEPNYYLSSIDYILKSPKENSDGVGALTSTNRDIWATTRKRLLEIGNEEILKKIDSALFAICLDDNEYTSDEPEKVVKELCCGSNPDNRWFDKSVSLIFSKNGMVGTNFEHAWGDGVALMRFYDEIINDNLEHAFVNEKTSPHDGELQVEELKFHLDDFVKDRIAQARREHLDRYNSVKFNFLFREGFGKADCKNIKVGPDAIMQLGFQIAHFHIKGKFAPTYESCTTALYRHGRTETVRPLTQEMKDCAEAFARGHASKSQLLNLLQACSKTHLQMTKNAAQGQGWDRHLFALKNLAVQENLPIPELFNDPAFKAINHIIISTSTLSSTNFGTGGFCPVVPDGYGLGYQIRGNELGVSTSTFKDLTNGIEMIDALALSYNAIAEVVQNSQS